MKEKFKGERVTLRFKDDLGNQLRLVLRQKKNNTYKVCAIHTKIKAKAVGATSVCSNQHEANEAMDRLEKKAIENGWILQVPVKESEEAGIMKVEFGERLFRDKNGNWVKDESASRPPSVPLSNMIYADAMKPPSQKIKEHRKEAKKIKKAEPTLQDILDCCAHAEPIGKCELCCSHGRLKDICYPCQVAEARRRVSEERVARHEGSR